MADLTKRGMLIAAVVLVVAISGFLSFRFWYTQIYLPSKPPVVIPPDHKFGKLPKPIFPDSSINSSELTYSLNTKTGNLPPESDVPKSIKVYFIPQIGTTLLAPDRARNLASKFNFTGSPEILSPTKYRFRDDSGGQFIIDLDSSNFFYNRKTATGSAQFANPLPSTEDLTTQFKTYLQTRGVLPDELNNGQSKVFFDGNPAEASTAAITLWPEKIDELSVVTPSFTRGLINGTVFKASDPDNLFPMLKYTFWAPDKSVFSTYPIKTPEEAFTDLKSGKGTIIEKPLSTNASITSIYLAYFESEEYNKYISPVFVFEGEHFAAYVPAVTDDYIETSK